MRRRAEPRDPGGLQKCRMKYRNNGKGPVFVGLPTATVSHSDLQAICSTLNHCELHLHWATQGEGTQHDLPRFHAFPHPPTHPPTHPPSPPMHTYMLTFDAAPKRLPTASHLHAAVAVARHLAGKPVSASRAESVAGLAVGSGGLRVATARRRGDVLVRCCGLRAVLASTGLLTGWHAPSSPSPESP